MGYAAPESYKKVAEVKSKAVARVIKKQAKVDKKKLEGFVVSENLKFSMTLYQAITLLGFLKKSISNEETDPVSKVLLLNMLRMGL